MLENPSEPSLVERKTGVSLEPRAPDAASLDHHLDASRSTRSPGTWFPILLGVLLGMIGFILLASSPFMDYIITLVFGGPPSKALFAHPAYYCVHRTILMLFCLAGGVAGAHWSAWRRRSRFMFLVGVLLVIAAFAAIGFH